MLALRSLRHSFDFTLRNLVTTSFRGREPKALASDLKAAAEVREFLEGFVWPQPSHRAEITAVDIGCRNFFLAPTLDELLRSQGFEPAIHGVEIDAYRRMRDLRSRKDYGDWYAGLIPRGEYHAMDFLNWKKPVDVAFLLHPFHFKRSILAWGLPLRLLKPEALFRHCVDSLVPGGLLLVSAPTPAELSCSLRLAEANGLQELQRGAWHPTSTSVQKRPRLGVLFRKPA